MPHKIVVLDGCALNPGDLAWAGAKGTDGESMMPVLRGARPAKPRPLFWHYPHYSNQGGEPGAAVRLGDYKLIRFYEDERRELYNLKDDPGEKVDLTAKMAARHSDLPVFSISG